MKKIKCDIEVPPNWRKGQTIFNFLEWLGAHKGYEGNQNYRMADPFQIQDKDWDKLYAEFVQIFLPRKSGGEKTKKKLKFTSLSKIIKGREKSKEFRDAFKKEIERLKGRKLK